MQPAPHPIHRRYYAEDLVRARRASEGRRYAGSQRRAKIDPNPHQIEAVMFALRRIPEGGCILADEVGLGKTIEAGLIIAQLLAEGAERILILVPKPLLGQWQNELYELFRIDTRDAGDAEVDLAVPGVFLAGREYAGSPAGCSRIKASPPFDLCVIDEAHEVFSGIHRRFDRHGAYDESSQHAQMAHRVSELIGAAPVLLLTATPIQNSLAELWGLIHYVEPTGTLFGNKQTFVELFCSDGDVRRVAPAQAEELRRRVGVLVQRTLRRQAQEFLQKPFVGRRAQLFEYTMGAEEKALYDDVTEYLLRPSLYAFDGRSRQLLLLGFHRRMASSTAALAKSLDNVAERLRSLVANEDISTIEAANSPFLQDLEEDESDAAMASTLSAADADMSHSSDTHGAGGSPVEELVLVESFVRRAKALPTDGKAESLVKAVQIGLEAQRPRQKLLIFTESLTTQEYLRQLLISRAGLRDNDITLFRGSNDSPRARQALDRWRDEVLPSIAPHVRPTPPVAVRLALVHEFENHSSVFISTEAGAKGLNLQFCDTVINYDLPWNPQRIEQRIGRCHRYGQSRDVTVINFLAKDNEAQRLTLEILATKLDLFGQVLDMSDVVLQTPRSNDSAQLATALGPGFESELRRIWDRARTVEEVEEELRQLRDSIEERRRDLETMQQHTIGLIESRLDESVREVFREISQTLPETLAEIDAELQRVLIGYLDAGGIGYDIEGTSAEKLLHINASPRLPALLQEGLSVTLGTAGMHEDVDPIHVAHPLIEAAVTEARTSGSGLFRVRFKLGKHASPALEHYRGYRGRLALTRIAYRGFEREDRLKVTAVFENADVLQPAAVADELLLSACESTEMLEPPLAVMASDLDEVVDEELFFDNAQVSHNEQANFEKAIDQLDQYMEDRILILRRARRDRVLRLDEAMQRRDGALGSDARNQAEAHVRRVTTELESLDEQLDRLVVRDDDVYRRWKQRAHQRRYETPRVERLLEAEFLIE